MSGDSHHLFLHYRLDFRVQFARPFSGKLAGKRNIRYRLENIEGIGPAKRKRLLAHFGTIKAVEQADEEQLRECKGITEADAGAIYRYFH